jgi:hypothetical protein
MSIIFHIVLKDLRCFKGALSVFALVLVIKWLVGFILISGDSAPTKETAEFLQYFHLVLAIIDVVLALLVVAGLIHEDPVVGTDATWLARPVRPIQLLLAKAASLVVALGLLPVAVTLPWWLLNDLTGVQIAQASLHMGLVNAGIVLAALPFAVVTRSIVGFFVSAIGLLVVLQATVVVVRVVVRESGAIPPSDPSTAIVVFFFSLLILTSLGVVMHQYLTRRTARSLALGIVGLVMAPVITAIVSRGQPAATKPASGGSELARNLEISLDHVERITRQSPLHLRLHFKTTGAPPGHAVLWFRFGQQILEWPGGRQDASGATVLDQAPTAEGVAALLAPQDAAGAPLGIDQRFRVQLRIPTAALDLLNGDLPRYTLTATFQLAEPHVIAIGPATAGTNLQRNGYSARVVERTIEGRVFELLTIETSPASRPSGFFSDQVSRTPSRSSHTTQLFLLMPDGKVIDTVPIRRNLQHTFLRIAGVQVAWRSTRYIMSDDLPRDALDRSGDAWMLGALHVEPVFTVTRTVTIDPFPLPSD